MDVVLHVGWKKIAVHSHMYMATRTHIHMPTHVHTRTQPQNSVPDVIIWMLSGNKRVAVHRIPSHLLMHSPKAKACGKLCKKIQTIFLLVGRRLSCDSLVLRM